MRRLVFTVILIALISVCVAYLFKPDKKIKYDSGKDTVESFGDGEYQLLRGSGTSVGLFNCQYHIEAVKFIDKWTEQDDNIYLVGTYPISFSEIADVKVKISLPDNTMYYYSENIPFEQLHIPYSDEMIENNKLITVEKYDYFSDEDRAVFESLV